MYASIYIYVYIYTHLQYVVASFLAGITGRWGIGGWRFYAIGGKVFLYCRGHQPSRHLRFFAYEVHEEMCFIVLTS